MASELVREMLDAGIHFGHRVSRWNPKMKPYIFGKRNMIHIVDIKETFKGLLRAKKYVAKVVAEGQDALFVGTKRQARNSIENHARRAQMHFVRERWLGGTLTNFKTIRSRLARLEELERLEESGELMQNFSKKMISTLQREKRKIKQNLDGIRRMDRFPGVLVIVDVTHEIIALREARKLGIPTICLIDTDGDPDLADIAIPGNDDSMRAIEIVVRELADAALEGLAARPEEQPAEAPGEGPGPGHGRMRPRRRPPQRERGPAAAPAASDSAAVAPAPSPAAEPAPPAPVEPVPASPPPTGDAAAPPANG